MAGVNALAQGIGMAGQSLGDSLGKAMEQRKTNSNLATALRKKLGILNPDRKDEFNAMSLPELTGEDMAHAEGVLEKRRKMEEEEADRRRREFEWAEADRRRREEGEAALPRFLDSFGNGAPAPMTPPPALGPAPSDQPWSPPPLMGLPPPDLGSSLTAPPPSPGAMPDGTMGPASLLEALRKNPKVLNSPRFGALWEAFQKAEDGVDWERIKPREFTTASGRRGVYGKGGQFQFEQQDLNPDGTTERTLSDGTLQTWNGRQWINAHRARGVSPDFTKSLGELAIGLDDPKNGPKVRSGIKAMIDSAHTLKQLDDEQRTALYGQFGIGAGAATPAAAPAPAAGGPPTISTAAQYQQLKSGDIYIDAATGKTKRKK